MATGSGHVEGTVPNNTQRMGIALGDEVKGDEVKGEGSEFSLERSTLCVKKEESATKRDDDVIALE